GELVVAGTRARGRPRSLHCRPPRAPPSRGSHHARVGLAAGLMRHGRRMPAALHAAVAKVPLQSSRCRLHSLAQHRSGERQRILGARGREVVPVRCRRRGMLGHSGVEASIDFAVEDAEEKSV
ncbi:unnamed protein product, partial [Urochloa humidicola]